MTSKRFTDPVSVSSDEVEALIGAACTPIIQFSKPSYDRDLLASLNTLCQRFGYQVEIRFFGHYGGAFDASVLLDIPDVESLYVDSLAHIRNEDCLFQLKALRRLSFGVDHIDRPDFLSGFDLSRFEGLSVSDTIKRNLDLAPLQAGRNLTDLFVAGHTKNISAIVGLPRLARLRLSSMPKTRSLEFVNDLPALKNLTLLLGGRSSIDEVTHSQLEELEIIRVKGLQTLGSLGRFPALRRLLIEDEAQLKQVSVSGAPLREMLVLNCKALESLDGLETAEGLVHLRVYKTQLDLENLAERNWPPSLKILALYSGGQKRDNAIRARLDKRGYSEFGRER